ncbi:type II toxin-antitoxin system RelE/ParE family toxin [Candidatus Magnetaquicoccus inordinatus]|uniref:type II toxin-antitoxin system RelE/ParE family toxin n=1 Tax=Candidatus Magnetaquicoccus inordinatus TaxID=2496818 RepID=UPI00102BFEBA|nr:type II toxin-antitoxin system RelE/ParE family toxin [Candidatus Magnetaquicoccus inordinatus]
MIKSFRDKQTELLNDGERVPRFEAVAKIALRKLDMLAAAHSLDDLRIPPNNRLESLHGDRRGQYSIRINDQFRICFEWQEGHACHVEIVDYH